MKLQYISNAGVLIEHKDTRVLCDPWLTDGAFYSWFHYPPLTLVPEDFAHVDYIYISHIHPDHLDKATLNRLPRTIKILILEFEEKYLLKTLRSLGFDTIIEIPHRGKFSLSEDFTIELLAADNCDPILCNKTFGCRVPEVYTRTLQIDSLAVFHGSGKTIVNSNDCPYELASAVCNYIKEQYPSIDLLLVGYNAASPYPQCFDNYNLDEKIQKAEEIKKKCLNRAIGYLEHLTPTHFMPFAGQYVLGGKLASLNHLRAKTETEELPAIFKELLAHRNLNTQLVLLNSGGWFELMSATADTFIPPNPQERQKYIEEVLSGIKYPFEHIYSEHINVLEKLEQAQNKMLAKMDEIYGGARSNWNLYIDLADKPENELFCVPFDGTHVYKAMRGEEKEPFIRISIEYDMLLMILDRKFHWNNADIGSHLRYLRKPDYFDSAFTYYLSYLHC
jgi:UDP-MurNAc hydroxylase